MSYLIFLTLYVLVTAINFFVTSVFRIILTKHQQNNDTVETPEIYG